jgi:PAS domain S-box-containing protein
MSFGNISPSTDYFEDLFDHARQNAIILMDARGMVTAINNAFSHWFGYKEKDIVGKQAVILFTEEDKAKGLPEKELATVLSTGQANDKNYLVHKDKTITWVSGESVLVKNKEGDISIVKILQNIHEQKESENALRMLNDLNENILSSIEDVVMILDNDLQVIKANNAFFDLFKNEVPSLPLSFAKLIHPYDEGGLLLALLQNSFISRKGFSNQQIEINTAAGDKKIFEVSCIPMKNKGDNVLLVVHDITIPKSLEREREDIVGFVAHELRNPLASLSLCNEIMSDAIHSNKISELEDMLKRSRNNVNRLNKLITELYDSTRLNAGNLQLEFSEFNFGNMIQEAIDMVKVLQPAYHIVVKGDGNILVRGDRYRLIQVVTNYLGNGIKYSDSKTDVILTIASDKNNVTVSVRDEGMGIPKSQLPFIFERFFRAAGTSKIEGLGLGLYLCRRIINAHHGNVWAESEQGKGSTFYFSIPLRNNG